MKNHVIESYENYCEEDRLSTNNARKIEFLTTIRIPDELLNFTAPYFHQFFQRTGRISRAGGR